MHILFATNLLDSMLLESKVWNAEIHLNPHFSWMWKIVLIRWRLRLSRPLIMPLVRFPTRSAFLNALICHAYRQFNAISPLRFHKRILVYITYLCMLQLDNYRTSDRLLHHDAEALITELQPENHPFMRDFFMFNRKTKSGVKSAISSCSSMRSLCAVLDTDKLTRYKNCSAVEPPPL